MANFQFNKSALYMVLAAVYGLTAVILGAMGTHALGLQPGTQQASLFQHAYIYQLIHALLLIWIVTQIEQGPWLRYAALALTFGILFFCGGLYLLVFAGKTAVAWITPVGGSLLILAWLNLVIHGLLKFSNPGGKFKS